MADKRERTEPGNLPSHPTVWAPRTDQVHKRAKQKLGTKASTQMVRHEDLQAGAS